MSRKFPPICVNEKLFKAGALALVGPPAPRHISYGSSQLVPASGIFYKVSHLSQNLNQNVV